LADCDPLRAGLKTPSPPLEEGADYVQRRGPMWNLLGADPSLP
jgi:hypothetical protein